ncbi:hypothetical protein OSB04_003167 [Centaurea solstitialis]|uniref:CRAL-TRIO domain-containing protein n=1 Tax=Centaurea solstitialis TaxID=347529 RepID=A0AA38WVL3_9ASTR|nr:hypothetical protein OSB04_003167 [Centaurea solstitialis]
MFRRRGSSQQQQDQEHHEQQPEAKLNELRTALGPLSGRNLIYCTDACLKRYLEARNWNVDKAKKMLEETLIWRSTYKPEEIRWVAFGTWDGTGWDRKKLTVSFVPAATAGSHRRPPSPPLPLQQPHQPLPQPPSNIDHHRPSPSLQPPSATDYHRPSPPPLATSTSTSSSPTTTSSTISTTTFSHQPPPQPLPASTSSPTTITSSTASITTIGHRPPLLEGTCLQEVAVEGETGKLFRANFRDRFGRSILIMKPGLQNTTSMDTQIRHLVYMMENAILNLPDGQEEMVWLIDFTGLSFSINVPIKTARDTVTILQNHYPQRLAVAILYSPPRIFEAFWKIVKYFLDPKTFQKVKFVYPKNKESLEVMKSFFDVDNLPTEFGGKATMKYDHEDFSKLMVQDDVKAAKLWGFHEKMASAATTGNHVAGAAVAPEPESVA